MNHRKISGRVGPSRRRVFRVIAVAGVCVTVGAGSVGCESAGQGAATGATVGALSGLAIGSMFGAAGTGAAVGAVVGGAGGAVLGDQNRRRSEQNAQAAAQAAATPAPAPAAAGSSAPVSPAVAVADQNRLALARFARSWSIAGWQSVNGQRRLITGSANGSVENVFFVRLEVSVTDTQSAWSSRGQVWFGSEPGRGITMDSRFDTVPIAVLHAGSVSADGRVFTLAETTPGVVGRQTVIRFNSDNQFVVDDTERVGGQTIPIGSLTFTASR